MKHFFLSNIPRWHCVIANRHLFRLHLNFDEHFVMFFFLPMLQRKGSKTIIEQRIPEIHRNVSRLNVNTLLILVDFSLYHSVSSYRFSTFVI